MAELIERDVKTIGKHINNALREELSAIGKEWKKEPLFGQDSSPFMLFTGFESGFQIYPFLSVTGGQEPPQSAPVRILTSQGFSTSSALLTLPVIRSVFPDRLSGSGWSLPLKLIR